MKRWLGLALAGLGVCLLLALGHPEFRRGMDHHPGMARWGRCLGPWEEPALASPAAAPAQNPGPHQAPPGVSESLPVELMLWTERDVGPAWLDSRGPPGKVRGTWSTPGLPARPVARSKRGTSPQGKLMQPDYAPRPRRGFATAFS